MNRPPGGQEAQDTETAEAPRPEPDFDLGAWPVPPACCFAPVFAAAQPRGKAGRSAAPHPEPSLSRAPHGVRCPLWLARLPWPHLLLGAGAAPSILNQWGLWWTQASHTRAKGTREGHGGVQVPQPWPTGQVQRTFRAVPGEDRVPPHHHPQVSQARMGTLSETPRPEWPLVLSF